MYACVARSADDDISFDAGIPKPYFFIDRAFEEEDVLIDRGDGCGEEFAGNFGDLFAVVEDFAGRGLVEAKDQFGQG